MDFEFAELARRIDAAAHDFARATVAFRKELDEPPFPFARHLEIARRPLYHELRDHRDPLAAVLAPWVSWLTLERALWSDHVARERAWDERSVFVEPIERTAVSVRAAVERTAVDASAGRRRHYEEALEASHGPVDDAERKYALRRSLALVELGAPAALGEPLEIEEAVPFVDTFLTRTEPLRDPGDRTWTAFVHEAFATDADAGWPAHLHARWIDDVLRPTGLSRGLTIDLGALPRPVGASSFVRAWGAFGAAFARAAVRERGSMCLLGTPAGLSQRRFGALFGTLPATVAFGVRVLGLSRSAARDQSRKFASALLVSLRIDAARVLLRDVLEREPTVRARRFEEVTDRVAGRPAPGFLLGMLPRIRPGATAAFAGTLLAMRDLETLVDHFDEDWFQNPRMVPYLRELAAEPALAPPSPEALEEGLRALVDRLAEHLS